MMRNFILKLYYRITKFYFIQTQQQLQYRDTEKIACENAQGLKELKNDFTPLSKAQYRTLLSNQVRFEREMSLAELHNGPFRLILSKNFVVIFNLKVTKLCILIDISQNKKKYIILGTRFDISDYSVELYGRSFCFRKI